MHFAEQSKWVRNDMGKTENRFEYNDPVLTISIYSFVY